MSLKIWAKHLKKQLINISCVNNVSNRKNHVIVYGFYVCFFTKKSNKKITNYKLAMFDLSTNTNATY